MSINCYRRNNELWEDVVDTLCCLAHALVKDFKIFISSKDWIDDFVFKLLVIR